MEESTITLFFGDSIVYGMNDNKNGGYVNIIKTKLINENLVFNLGIPGELTSSLLIRFEEELQNRYNVIDDYILVFGIGINDVLNYVPIEEIQYNIEKIIRISKKYTNKIYFLGLTKVYPDDFNAVIKEVDEMIENVCKKEDIKHIKLFDIINETDLSDGLHPNSEGHKKIADIIYNKIFNM